MTKYFDDKKAHILNCLRPAFLSGVALIDELESSLDGLKTQISLCMAVPGFPDDIACAIHRDFAKYLPEPLAGIHQELVQYGEQKEDGGMYNAAVLLVDSLHDLFHTLGERARGAPADSPLAVFANDPRAAMLSMVDTQDERRLAILRESKAPHAIELVRRYDEKVARERAEAAKNG